MRRQLSTARTTRVLAAAPPLPMLALELETLAAEWRRTGNLPLKAGGAGRRAYESLRTDLDNARGRAGERVQAAAEPALRALADALASEEPPTRETLAQVLGSGEELAQQLREPAATVAAFDDVLDGAAALDGAGGGLDALESLLDTFRAMSELRGLQWPGVKATVAHLLSVSTVDPEGHPMGGPLPRGSSPDEVRGRIHDYLRRPPTLRTWAVWLAVKAGPGDHGDPLPTVIGNGVAVCGVACDGDVEQWLEDARAALISAYRKRQLPVPDDVASMGEPERRGGEVLLDGAALWRSVAEPPSFVARVEVSATSEADAADQARAALAAVLGQGNRWLPGDIRSDVWLWAEEFGWIKPSHTARDLALGEIDAARHAGDAVATWTAHLTSPLDRDEVRLMQTRVLVNDPDASSEVRLMRGVSALEGLYRHKQVFDALDRLWLRSAWSIVRRDLDHLLWYVGVGHGNVDAPSTEKAWTALRRNQRELQARVSDLRYDASLIAEVVAAIDPLDRDTATWAWVRAMQTTLDDRTALRRWRISHADACRRANRHRNLVTHGWTIGEDVAKQSADFIAWQLELAVQARDGGRVATVLQGADRDADESWIGRSPGDLLEAVSSAWPR